jgi:hypothetical protein
LSVEAGRPPWLAGVLAVAAAVVFSAGGLYLLAAPDLVMLRLAVLDFPAWPVYVLGALQIAGGVALLRPGTRRFALGLLAVISLGELAASVAYREPEPAAQAMIQLLLLVAILFLGGRRPD